MLAIWGKPAHLLTGADAGAAPAAGGEAGGEVGAAVSACCAAGGCGPELGGNL